MRCYDVKGTGADGQKLRQFAGTQADARATRQGFVDDHGAKKLSVAIDEVEVPTAKDGLISFLNNLIKGE